MSIIAFKAFFIHLSLLKNVTYLFLERGRVGERERERNINVWLSFTSPLLGTSRQPRQVP